MRSSLNHFGQFREDNQNPAWANGNAIGRLYHLLDKSSAFHTAKKDS
jgi:hypothetical protein